MYTCEVNTSALHLQCSCSLFIVLSRHAMSIVNITHSHNASLLGHWKGHWAAGWHRGQARSGPRHAEHRLLGHVRYSTPSRVSDCVHGYELSERHMILESRRSSALCSHRHATRLGYFINTCRIGDLCVRSGPVRYDLDTRTYRYASPRRCLYATDTCNP